MKIKKLSTTGFTHDFVMVAFILVFAVGGVAYLIHSHAASKAAVLDISQPECDLLGSLKHFNGGIVGVNNTAANFSSNPCLAQEVTHFRYYNLYTAVNYPSPACENKKIYDPFKCGQAAAQYSLNYAASQRVHSSTWWIDVEEGNGLHWTKPHHENIQFLNGVWSALAGSGIKYVGFYSTAAMWKDITGGWQNSSPTWYASGEHSYSGKRPSNLVSYCPLRFTHRSNIYVQYISHHIVPGQQIDVDVPC